MYIRAWAMCTYTHIYIYIYMPPRRCTAFVSFISFISYWYISGKRCPAAISSFASTRACSICNFLYDDDVHTCTFFSAAMLRARVRCTAFILTRLRLFSISDVYVTARRIKRSSAAAHSHMVFISLFQYQILVGFAKLKK